MLNTVIQIFSRSFMHSVGRLFPLFLCKAAANIRVCKHFRYLFKIVLENKAQAGKGLIPPDKVLEKTFLDHDCNCILYLHHLVRSPCCLLQSQVSGKI